MAVKSIFIVYRKKSLTFHADYLLRRKIMVEVSNSRFWEKNKKKVDFQIRGFVKEEYLRKVLG